VISSIEGIIQSRTESSVIVEVGGFGIQVFVPERVLMSIGGPGERVRFLTWLYVREDILSLFGFPEESDRRLFLLLIGVSGIGPKLALGILSACDSNEIASFLHAGDTTSLVRLPGVGKKTAERLIVELKDKVDVSVGQSMAKGYGGVETGMFEEAAAALVSIGLTAVNAQKALETVDVNNLGDNVSVEDLVRDALRKASS
jgi:Holliday junction DNA helicase RuvA